MPDPLHSDLPRGSDEGGSPVGPSAGFIPTAEIEKDAELQFKRPNVQGRLFLGLTSAAIQEKALEDGRIERHAKGGNPIGIPDDRHFITVAGSRAGKGRSVIIPNLIHYPGSVLAIDPKGDLARYTADWRADVLNQKVVVLDPFGEAGDVTKRHGGSFNPLSILSKDSEDLVEDSGLIADALIIPAPGTKDPHWDESSKQFLEGVILHVATLDKYANKRDLISVYNCIVDIESNDTVKNEMLENPEADFAVQTSATQYFDKSDAERSGVLSSLRRHIRFLGYKRMQNVLRGHDFNLGQLKTENMSVFLSLPALRMGTCSRWLRLFVNLTLAALEAEKTRPKHPVLMCLDEFAVLGTMKTLEDAAGQIAGLGCKLWPILQDIGQLRALYGDRWETFLGNSGILQFFGNSDLQTLEWISKRLGETTIKTINQNQTGHTERGKSGAMGMSSHEGVHSLMTLEEISRFFGRDDKLLRQLIIRPTCSPMVLQRANYDTHEVFDDYRRYMAKIAT